MLYVCVVAANACTSFEFQCDDGQCINIAWRCDDEFDCEDRSDEGSALCGECRPFITFGFSCVNFAGFPCLLSSWKVLDLFFSKISRTVRKVLKNEFGPGKSWKLI